MRSDLGHDLDLKFSRSNMKFIISRPKMVWLLRNEKQTYQLNSRHQMQSKGLTLAMTLTLDFQGQILKQPYLRNRRANWHWTKGGHWWPMTMTFWWPRSRVTLYTAGHLHTAVPHCSHSRAPIVHTAVPRENNDHGCVYLRCRAVCKLPGCVEGHPWRWGVRIYLIVTGVTSDVCVPSTPLVNRSCSYRNVSCKQGYSLTAEAFLLNIHLADCRQFDFQNKLIVA